MNEGKQWEFTPSKTVKVDSRVVGGDIFGHVYENELLDTHYILVPPRVKGKVTFIAPAGNYDINHTLMEVEHDGKKTKVTMAQ